LTSGPAKGTYAVALTAPALRSRLAANQRASPSLRERFASFRRRDLYEIRLVALLLAATFIARSATTTAPPLFVVSGCG
jgi:hypothetical protein